MADTLKDIINPELKLLFAGYFLGHLEYGIVACLGGLVISLFSIDPNLLISSRLTDIVVGSLIGCLGGWLLHRHRLF